MASSEPAATPVRRKTSGALVALIVLLVLGLIVGGLVVADNLTRSRAETEIAANLQTEMGTLTPPDVQIGGFSFLAQAIMAEFEHVSVAATDLGATTDTLPIRQLDATLDDVVVGRDYATFSAATVSGRAQLDLSSLGDLAGRSDLTYAGEGRVKLTVQASVLGATVQAEISGRVQLDVAAQTLTLQEPSVTVAGVELPAQASEALINTFVRPVPITGVPYGLDVTSLTIDDSGITVDLAGQNVAFTN